MPLSCYNYVARSSVYNNEQFDPGPFSDGTQKIVENIDINSN